MAVVPPYMTVAQVQERFKAFTFSSSTAPTDTEVTGYIALISDNMEERFRACRIDVTDIDNGKADKLEYICGLGVLAMIYRTLDVQAEKEKRYEDLYQREIKTICDSPQILATTTFDKTGVAESYPDRTPPFERETDNW